jgi:hypothetical protein
MVWYIASLEWCRWAGVKRIFYWDETEGSFLCVKVNEAGGDHYETQADMRLYTRTVGPQLIDRSFKLS